MRSLVCVLSLAVLWQVSGSWAQLAPPNEIGLSFGHLHVFSPEREKEAKAWLTLGGQLGNNLSGNIPIKFPGIVVLVGQERPVTGGSAGSLIDHVGFRVPDLQASLANWKGVSTWWKEGNWGLKIEPGTKPGQAFVTTPGGTRCEILEDKSLTVPILFDHAHYFVEESRLKQMQDYYARMFGAKPTKGEADTFDIPGGKLVFSKSATPTAETMGRSLDHVGFNMLNAEALAAFVKTLEAKGANIQRYQNSSMGMIRLLDGFGAVVEVTKSQGGYFDIKLLDKSFYLVDEGGRKEGETPTRPR